MVIARITTITNIANLIWEIVVDLVPTPRTAHYVNAKQKTLKSPRFHYMKMISRIH